MFCWGRVLEAGGDEVNPFPSLNGEGQAAQRPGCGSVGQNSEIGEDRYSPTLLASGELSLPIKGGKQHHFSKMPISSGRTNTEAAALGRTSGTK
jgi:hypothetical protein